MAYADPAELAAVLNITVTTANTPALQACLDAAAVEIDHHVTQEGLDKLTIPDALLNRVNLNRAVDWWKGPDTFNGAIGYTDTGILQVPTSDFRRHAAMLLPYKVSWGLA